MKIYCRNLRMEMDMKETCYRMEMIIPVFKDTTCEILWKGEWRQNIRAMTIIVSIPLGTSL